MPRDLTPKGERLYEHVKQSYAGDPRAEEIAARTVYARAREGTEGLVKRNRPEHNPRHRANPDADEFDAVRFIGDACIYIKLDEDDSYSGVIEVPNLGSASNEKSRWAFSEINASKADARVLSLDSDEMFDKIAQSAASFGSYYTSHNRAQGVPSWAPDPETADDIDQAVSGDLDDAGRYSVRRKSGSGATRNPSPAKNYKFYVARMEGRTAQEIDSGWDYRQDAQDRLNELSEDHPDITFQIVLPRIAQQLNWGTGLYPRSNPHSNPSDVDALSEIMGAMNECNVSSAARVEFQEWIAHLNRKGALTNADVAIIMATKRNRR